jgi:hypothetical protein
VTTADEKKRCFVISPIGTDGSPARAAADKVLKHLIRKALGSEYDVERADEDTNPGAITTRMVASILEADLIVADLSGANPNVFYEVAIAHGYGKPTVHIQTAKEELPFDVKDMRTIKYDISDPDELEKSQRLLRDYAAAAQRDGVALVTPLSAAQRFVSVSTSADPIAESNVQVLEALESLADDVRRISRRLPARTTPLIGAGGSRSEGEKGDGRAFTANVVNDDTSTGFDSWAAQRKQQLMAVMNVDDEEVANQTLVDPDSTFLDEDNPDE